MHTKVGASAFHQLYFYLLYINGIDKTLLPVKQHEVCNSQ